MISRENLSVLFVLFSCFLIFFFFFLFHHFSFFFIFFEFDKRTTAPPLRPGITWMRLENIAKTGWTYKRTMFVERVRWIVILVYERVYDR